MQISEMYFRVFILPGTHAMKPVRTMRRGNIRFCGICVHGDCKKYQIMLLSYTDGKPRPYSLFIENRTLFQQPLHFSIIIYSLVEQKSAWFISEDNECDSKRDVRDCSMISLVSLIDV